MVEDTYEIDEWEAVPFEASIANFARICSEQPMKAPAESVTSAICTDGIRPVDLYLYLKARFGDPNGLTMLVKNYDDNENLIHWHYTLKCPSGQLEFYCFSFRIEILHPFGGRFQKQDFLKLIKTRFGRHGRRIKELRDDLERWKVFLNPYARLRSIIESNLKELLEINLHELPEPVQPRTMADWPEFERVFEAASTNYYRAAHLGLTVRMLAPVWAESLINLFIFILVRPEIRSDRDKYQSLIRQPIHERVRDLAVNCRGFQMPVPFDEWEIFKDFHTMMNGRNDLLHGNITPELAPLGEIYFQEKTPLFLEFGDFASRSYKVSLLRATPEQAERDYVIVQDLGAHLLLCLDLDSQELVSQLLLSRELGWDDKRKIVGKLHSEVLVDMLQF